MLRAHGLLLALVACCGCRYWSGSAPSADESRAPTSVQATGLSDWQLGKLSAPIANEVPKPGGEIVTVVSTDPPSLNTIVDSDWIAAQITEHRIYESLVDTDPYDHPNYRHRPCLAQSWEISADKLTYTFRLRRDVSWHDGQQFTAKDVIATFDKVQDPNTKAMHIRAYTRDLESYRALDDYTVQFRFKQPYFLVMDGIFADVPIQPAHRIASLSGSQYNEAASNAINRAPIGTGPFRFESWQANQHISLRRHDKYWGRAPYVERVVFRIVKESTIALELAGRNEIDVLPSIRAEQWVRMQEGDIGRYYQRSLFHGANYSWIGYNENRRLFADKRLRRALTLLIDRPGIIQSLQHGLARATTCHFYADSQACDPDLKPLPYDPAAAAALLDEAGWQFVNGQSIRRNGAERLSFSLMLPAGSEDAARMATLIKESLLRAGIDMRLQRVEWSAFVKRLRDRDFDACALGWSNSSPRSDPTQIWHSSSIAGGSNYIGYSSLQVDALIEKARGELDDDRRNAMYRELGRLLHEDQPYTWLFILPRLALIHRRIHGAQPSLVGWRYEDWWVEGDRTQWKGAR
jgi:peptide/nickel transport system substrate-binding protein